MDANNYRLRHYFRIPIIGLTFIIMACAIPDRKSNGKAISHQTWTEVLQNVVEENGTVDYQALKENPDKFHLYLKSLKNNHPDIKTWSRNERLAYWINAYNAFTVQLIIENYPLESIKDLNSTLSIPFVNTIWDKSFIEIGDFSYSLNDIEHRILRKKFNEPRIHFAINCASISCAQLRKEAYHPENLDKQLADQAKTFINDDSKNQIGKDEIKISKLFTWFKGDFKNEGTIIDFLNKYSDTSINDNANISFMDYNWSLNEYE